MALLDHLRRLAMRDPHRGEMSPDSVTPEDVPVGVFLDEQCLQLAKNCAIDYARLRAGDNADALLVEPWLAAALDRASWESYPRALTMVGTLVEGLLRAETGDNPQAMQFGLVAMILEHFDRRPVPAVIGEVDWRAERADIESSLTDLARRRPKSVDAIVRDHSSYFLAIMPLHAKLAADDFPVLCNQLKSALLQIQEKLMQRVKLPELAAELATRMPKVEAGDAPSAPQ